MELKKHISPIYVCVGLYIVAFLAYIIYGLQPVEAANYEVSAELAIPSIGLESDVTTLHLENRELKTPDTIVGSFTKAKNKTLLIGHASTVFRDLNAIEPGDEIIYDDAKYVVASMEIIEKDAVDMGVLLKEAEKETLVVMTCAGDDLGKGDATHRLIITASIE